MRKCKLFIAMSLDGYIADDKGKVDWLQGHGEDEQTDAYSEFIKDIDTILMGWNTYHQIVNELSAGNWIYDNCYTYVFTHKQVQATENICFIDSDPIGLINQLKETKGKDIWVCGGAGLVQQLIRGNCIDEYYITVIPTLLGSGIRLFKCGNQALLLKLTGTRSYNGMVDLIYSRR